MSAYSDFIKPVGGLRLLQTQIVTEPVAAIDFTGIDDSYAYHILETKDVDTDFESSTAQMHCYLSADGGGTWLTGAADYNEEQYDRSWFFRVGVGGTSNQINFSRYALFNLADAANHSACLREGHYRASAGLFLTEGSDTACGRVVAEANTSLRLTCTNANFVAGAVRLYGVIK